MSDIGRLKPSAPNDQSQFTGYVQTLEHHLHSRVLGDVSLCDIAVFVPVFVDGKIPFALGTAVYPERLGEILKEQKLPRNWIAAIFDSTGTIVARTHFANKLVGKRGSPALGRRMGEASEGVLESETLEGIPVLTGFSRSAVSGWAVVIGVPRSETLDVLHRSLWLSIAGASARGMFVAGASRERSHRQIHPSLGEERGDTGRGRGDPRRTAWHQRGG